MKGVRNEDEEQKVTKHHVEDHEDLLASPVEEDRKADHEQTEEEDNVSLLDLVLFLVRHLAHLVHHACVSNQEEEDNYAKRLKRKEEQDRERPVAQEDLDNTEEQKRKKDSHSHSHQRALQQTEEPDTERPVVREDLENQRERA